MDLENFVASTLSQIIRGIKRAQTETADSGSWINPVGTLRRKEDATVLQTDIGSYAYLTDVEFDVAVTANNEERAGAKAGITVWGMGLGAEGETAYEKGAISRVMFKVPVAWPGQHNPELEEKLAEKKATADKKVRNPYSGFQRR